MKHSFFKNKKSTLIILILIVLIILIILIVLLLILNDIKNNSPKAIINGKTINLELANTAQEQEQGLMYRNELDENSAMLFIFQDEQIRSFWMKNTLIPLDIIFIDSNNMIVDIQAAEPCKSDPCINYVSKYPAKYVLEVNQGYSERNNISIGDKLDMHLS